MRIASLALFVIAVTGACNSVDESPPAPPPVEVTVVRQAVDLNATADDADNGTQRFAGATAALWVGVAGQCAPVGSRGRALNVQFDLSGIPSCATVTGATLTFTHVGCATCGLTNTLSISRISSSWSESAQAGACAGVTSSADSALSTSSVRESVAVGGLTGAATSTFSFSSTNLRSDVQDFISGSLSNNGWRLTSNASAIAVDCNVYSNPPTNTVPNPNYCGSLGTGCGGNKKHIQSSESASPPELTVTYTLNNANCNDGNPCTDDTCTASGCSFSNDNSNSCTDGRSCTNDACVSGSCVSTPSNANCNDGNVCTNDTCNPSSPSANSAGCVYSNNSNACDDNAFCNGADTCSGGTCSVHSGCPCPGDCAGSCNEGTNSCTGAPCGGTTACPAGFYCQAGSCQAQRANGQNCSQGFHCLSNNCSDGVCCNTACGGQCEACNLPNSTGTCAAVTGDPVGARPSCGGGNSETCRPFCNGSNRTACTFPGSSTVCRERSCTDGVATLQAVCDGAGNCPARQTQECGDYSCTRVACRTACVTDPHCAEGLYCDRDERTCEPLLDDGAPCERDGQCAAKRCVDGYCCNEACDGQCEACDVAGEEGECQAITGAPRNGRPQCAGDDPVCGGVCDGTKRTSCTYAGLGVRCNEGSCADGSAIPAAFCQGTGECVAPAEVNCRGEACTDGLCDGDCRSDEDCNFGEFCEAGFCAPLRATGQPCASANECASSICADGVCCGTACTGQCEACNEEGFEGFCRLVTGDPRGARPPCSGFDEACRGACDGTVADGCTYPDSSIQCTAGSCSFGVATLPTVCTGNGKCSSPQAESCIPATCRAAICNGDCTSDVQCAADEQCLAGFCSPKFENGQACMRGAQCSSGFCIDGLCCETACSDICAACDEPGQEGTCVAVVGRPRGNRPRCGGFAACEGTCDGTTTTVCSFPGVATTCGEPYCENDVEYAAPRCNGAGSCTNGIASDCRPNACDETGTACERLCDTDDDCLDGSVCENGECVFVVDAGPMPPGDASADAASGTGGAGPGPDGGASGSGSGSGGRAPIVDAGSDAEAGTAGGSGDDSGCGCRVAGTDRRSHGAAAALLGVALLVLRRRSRSAGTHRTTTG